MNTQRTNGTQEFPFGVASNHSVEYYDLRYA